MHCAYICGHSGRGARVTGMVGRNPLRSCSCSPVSLSSRFLWIWVSILFLRKACSNPDSCSPGGTGTQIPFEWIYFKSEKLMAHHFSNLGKIHSCPNFIACIIKHSYFLKIEWDFPCPLPCSSQLPPQAVAEGGGASVLPGSRPTVLFLF